MNRAITATIICQAGETSAPVQFRYDPADPFAIAMDDTAVARALNPADTSTRRPWMFLRSLLTDALVADGPFGLADVVIERDGAWIQMTLSSHDGRAVVRFAHFAVLRFTQRTAALVPLGSESDHLDVDTAIARLLGGVR